MRLALVGVLLAGALLDGASRRGGPKGSAAPRPRGEVQLASYLAGCALGEGESIELYVDEEKRTFEGQFGFAPTWWSGNVTREEQRWTTACLLARTNLFRQRVRIAMRGAHPRLKAAPGGPDIHTVQEGAFYGDLFGGPSSMYACSGDHAPGSSVELTHRVCAERAGTSPRTRCGFVYTGMCSDACELDADGGYYRRCRGGDQTHDEVITVYLARRIE